MSTVGKTCEDEYKNQQTYTFDKPKYIKGRSSLQHDMCQCVHMDFLIQLKFEDVNMMSRIW
jgi:hypothetical protein